MPGRIVVVGLGPGDPDLRTVGAQRALASASRIILRTAIHPGIADLLADPRVSTCDDLYETGRDFPAVYAAVAERVLAAAEHLPTTSQGGYVVFAVPGHPGYGEESVLLLRDLAARRGIALEVLPAVSAVDVVATALGVDPLSAQAQLLDGAALAALPDRDPYGGGLLGLDPTRPCLIAQVYSAAVASGVKLALARLYPEDHPIAVVSAAGVPGEERVRRCPLHELDRGPVDHLTSVWVPPEDPLDAVRAADTLPRIVARLRAPGGCPWDREQTLASLRRSVLDEAYEVADAIDAEDNENLTEELGDLSLLVAMLAQIAEEAGDFALEDVREAVNRKIVRRHPHVFGTVDARNPEAVVATWNEVKAAERRDRGQPERPPDEPLARLPRSLPALQRAAAVLRTTGRDGHRVQPPPGDEVGGRILGEVARAVHAGLDPERELDRALHRYLDGIATDARQETTRT